jgi:hypothetical protein
MTSPQHESAEAPPLNPFVGLYGRRHVRQLEQFVQQLRVREREDAHGNRRLFLDPTPHASCAPSAREARPCNW